MKSPHPSGRPIRQQVKGVRSEYRRPWKGALTPRLDTHDGQLVDAVGFTRAQPAEDWEGAWAKDKR